MTEDRYTMANTERKRAYNSKYTSEMKKMYAVKLSKRYDAEYIELLDTITNKPAFIRKALEDYARENNLPVPSRRKPDGE